jgi:hypothetical protein
VRKMIGVAVLGVALMAPLGLDVADAEASTHSMVLCGKASGADLLVRKPRSCMFNYRSMTGAYMTIVQNMRWRNWGGPVTSGRGTLFANSNYPAPIRFRLYRRQAWEDGIRFHTRVRGTLYDPDRGLIRVRTKL